MKTDGRVYDTHQEHDWIMLWVKTAADHPIRLTCSSLAELYAEPKRHTAGELTEIISNNPLVESASTLTWRNRF